MERRCTGLGGAGGDLECRGGTAVLGIGADVPDPLADGDGFARAAGLCGAGRDRRVGGGIFSHALGYLRPRLRSLPRWTFFVQSPVAGLCVGLIGFFGFPQVMGAGYEVMNRAMHGQFTWKRCWRWRC